VKKLMIGIIVLALLGGGAYLYFGRSAPAPAEAPVAAAAPVLASNAIVAEAKVVPARSAELSLPTSGTIAEVLVTEGDQVKAGQVLARLDTAAQQAVVAQNAARLRKSEADLADLLDGPQLEDIAVAEAGLRQAQAQLRQTLGRPATRIPSCAQRRPPLGKPRRHLRASAASFRRVRATPSCGFSRPASA